MKTQSQLLWACFASVCVFVAPLASATIPDTERQALVDLYNATDGDNWIDNTNWLGPVGTECTWFGVRCGELDLNVGALYLSWNNLSGAIPATIDNLEWLTDVIARGNRISGTIPQEIGNLTRLTRIELSENNLTGRLPVSVGNLIELGRLDLTSNYLQGPLPDELATLENLQRISLGDNPLSQDVNHVLAILSSVSSVDVSGAWLIGTAADDLIDPLSTTEFSLHGNSFDVSTNATSSWLDDRSGDWRWQGIPLADITATQTTGSSVQISWDTEFPLCPSGWCNRFIEFELGPTSAGPFESIGVSAGPTAGQWTLGGIPNDQEVFLRVVSHLKLHKRLMSRPSAPLAVHLARVQGWFHVAADGDDNNTCETPDDPCATIQSAIDRAMPQATVLVGAGTFTESLIVNKNITLIGAGIAETSVDGQRAGTTLSVVDGATLQVRDIRITNGEASPSNGHNGGNVHVANSASIAALRIRIDNGAAAGSGGGVLAIGDATMLDVVIDHNTASTCAGLDVREAFLIRTQISDNQAAQDCGGICSHSGEGPLIRDSMVLRNQAGGFGGGGCYRASVEESVIAENTAQSGGGWYAGGSFLTTTIAGNHADLCGGALSFELGSDAPLLLQSTVTGNSCGHPNCAAVEPGPRTAIASALFLNSPRNCAPTEPSSQSGQWNLSDDASCGFETSNGWDELQAMASPYVPHGDEPAPVRPLVGSPLIDATGRGASLHLSDQTGLQAPIDGNGDGTPERDIGAVEFNPTIFVNGFEDGTMNAWVVGPDRG